MHEEPAVRSKVELVQSARSLKEQFISDKHELEEYYKEKLQESERRHLEMQDRMRKKHEHQMNAKQSQIDALISRCNEYKGENNLLQIKVSKMMDMLAECAAEVNLQEAELAQASCSLRRPQSDRRTVDADTCYLRPQSDNRTVDRDVGYLRSNDEYDDEDDDED